MTISIVPGVFDVLPTDPNEPWRQAHLWEFVEQLCRHTARLYCLNEVRTPILERLELFQRGVGEGTDIVSKEMYVFEDRGKRLLALRPEGTAPVMRSFIEKQLHTVSPVQRFFYIAPMFRYERQQAGRYRQHHQFGVEIIGIPSPDQDAELIELAYTIFTQLGLQNLCVNINSLGTESDRTAYRQALLHYLKKHVSNLSANSQVRLEQNPLRILDSKDPGDQAIVSEAPSIQDFLDPETRAHFDAVLSALNALSIPFEINPRLVRGLDYYNKTVFEVVSGDLGAQNSVCGGGRYDGLLKKLGGPDLPTLGFGMGLERVIQTMIKQNSPLPDSHAPLLYIIPLGSKVKQRAMALAHALRAHGIACQMEFTDRKVGKSMQYADQIHCAYTTVIGDQEIETGQLEVKHLQTGEKTQIPLNTFAEAFKRLISC